MVSFELPYLEDIYDMETDELETILARIKSDMQRGPAGCSLPLGIDSFEKYERKAEKLKGSIELELEERQQVDNVLNFFTDSSKNFLDDDKFYKLDEVSGTATAATQPSNQALSQLFRQANSGTESAKDLKALEHLGRVD